MLTENKLFGDRETVANDSIVADNATVGNSIAPKTHHLDRHHRFELFEKRGFLESIKSKKKLSPRQQKMLTYIAAKGGKES